MPVVTGIIADPAGERAARCLDKYGIGPHIQFGRSVERMEWDETTGRWHIATATGEAYMARAIVSGTGALHVPSVPEIPGAGQFTGAAFHSAQWDHSCDLSGKRVAVIGTGASAIQFIPEIAKQAAQVHVFQRTPPWIHPRPDIEIPPAVRATFAAAPPVMRAFRDGIYWALEARAAGFAVHPRLMAPLQSMAERHIERQIGDPALRAKVTPDYTLGCKRILLSSDYYPALTRPNVDLVTEPVARITEHGLACADGSAYDADVIIYGTGFKTIDAVAELNVAGRDGVKLQDVWRGGIEAYHGITVAGFPNFFLLLGPHQARPPRRLCDPPARPRLRRACRAAAGHHQSVHCAVVSDPCSHSARRQLPQPTLAGCGGRASTRRLSGGGPGWRAHGAAAPTRASPCPGGGGRICRASRPDGGPPGASQLRCSERSGGERTIQAPVHTSA
jgi:cation diffusion facilitator CzcD-associated flavoprotein CzcO